MVSPDGCDAEFLARLKQTNAPSPPHTLGPPRWKSVCFGLQVFGKNCVNSLLKCARKKRPRADAFTFQNMPRSLQILMKRLALREPERPARLGAAVLLALDHARVAREKAALFEKAAKIRLEIGQRLRNAVTHGASLARQASAGHGADHVILAGARGRDQRLLDHHPQHRTREINFDFAGVDRHLAGAGLDPDAGDRVLALAGRIGAAVFVDLLDIFRRFRSGRLELRQLIERLHGIGHLMRPSCSCDSLKQRPGFRAAGPRADDPARGKPANYRAARGPAVPAGSCARWPSRPRAQESAPRISTLPCAP